MIPVCLILTLTIHNPIPSLSRWIGSAEILQSVDAPSRSDIIAAYCTSIRQSGVPNAGLPVPKEYVYD
jgi:hypothetical protein